MKTLILIPARAGSKGLPRKNVKLLAGKPLVCYTFDFAKQIFKEGDVICVSTNDDEIIDIAIKQNIPVAFKRPEHLATDSAGSFEVIMHALSFFENKGYSFDNILLLQPTSPIRLIDDFRKVASEFDKDCDMVVTVKQSKDSPYFNLFEEVNGYLEKSKPSAYVTRQECPPVYVYNGSMYLINVKALKATNSLSFKRNRKVIMPDERSVDIDTIKDWIIAEHYLKEQTNIK